LFTCRAFQCFYLCFSSCDVLSIPDSLY
jgi:hypothetical protein